jgi:hypothetical protein
MARRIFWRDPTMWVINPSTGNPIPAANVTLWTRRTGGVQITDVWNVDDDGVVTTSIAGGTLVSDALGILPSFAGPNDGTHQLWADAGSAAGRMMLKAEQPANSGDNTSLVAGDGTLVAASTFAGSTHAHAVADLPAGSVLFKAAASGVWPVRGTTRADIMVIWVKTATSDADPAIDSTYMKTGVDILLRRT